MPEPITPAEFAEWEAACVPPQVAMRKADMEVILRAFIETASEAMPRLHARVRELEAGLTDLINNTPVCYDPHTSRHNIRTRCHRILQGNVKPPNRRRKVSDERIKGH